MVSVVDDPEIGRRLRILRGQEASGECFNLYGVRTDGGDVDHRGHRFEDGRRCTACGLYRSMMWDGEEPDCAYATMPPPGHNIDPCTGSCTRCGARQEEFEDNVVPNECPQNRGALDKILDAEARKRRERWERRQAATEQQLRVMRESFETKAVEIFNAATAYCDYCSGRVRVDEMDKHLREHHGVERAHCNIADTELSNNLTDVNDLTEEALENALRQIKDSVLLASRRVKIVSSDEWLKERSNAMQWRFRDGPKAVTVGCPCELCRRSRAGDIRAAALLADIVTEEQIRKHVLDAHRYGNVSDPNHSREVAKAKAVAALYAAPDECGPGASLEELYGNNCL